MAVLTPDELTALRRETARDEHPDWDKPTINAALQGAEDVLEAQAFDATAFVTVTTTVNTAAQLVEAALSAGQIPASLVPVAEDWLVGHPPSVSDRSVDTHGIHAWGALNQPAFVTAVAGMPVAQRAKVVRLVVRRRVEAVV